MHHENITRTWWLWHHRWSWWTCFMFLDKSSPLLPVLWAIIPPHWANQLQTGQTIIDKTAGYICHSVTSLFHFSQITDATSFLFFSVLCEDFLCFYLFCLIHWRSTPNSFSAKTENKQPRGEHACTQIHTKTHTYTLLSTKRRCFQKHKCVIWSTLR